MSVDAVRFSRMSVDAVRYICAVMQGMITEDATMCSWKSADAVGRSDAWHDD